MDDLLSLLQFFRKLEALFLPLMPLRWRAPPPTYRLFTPLLRRLTQYKDRYPWADPLIAWLEDKPFHAYHKDGLAIGELSPGGMAWARSSMLGVGLVMVAALVPTGPVFSFWVKVTLLFGICVLLLCGVMQVSVSALWASWLVLFFIMGVLMLGISPWAMLALAVFGLVWHVPLVSESAAWHWYDAVATLPYLFLWTKPVASGWLQTWPMWQCGLLGVALWLCVWATLWRAGRYPAAFRAVQYFWPASLVSLILLIGLSAWAKKLGIQGIARWLVWVALAVAISAAMSLATKRLRSWPFLFGPLAVVLVLAACAGLIGYRGARSSPAEYLATSMQFLYDQSWPIWWLIGASVVLAIRRTAVILLRWFRALLPGWLLPMVVWIIIGWAFFRGWFSSPELSVGSREAIAAAILFGLGVTFLVWRKKETPLREWLFWGFYIWFLVDRYGGEVRGVTSGDSGFMGWRSFVFLCVWALWMSYIALGTHLALLREKASERSAVALMGAFLLLVMAVLWMGFVDRSFPAQSRMRYELLLGFTYLGIPFVIYHLILRHYLPVERSVRVPWGWILLIGLGLVQLFQGVEHYVVGMAVCPSLDDLHKALKAALYNRALDSAAPAWVVATGWWLSWRVIRWLTAMAVLTCVIRRRKQEYGGLPTGMTAAAFTSLFVAIAEMSWMVWPGLHYDWAVVLRPWKVTLLAWDKSFALTCLVYGLAGILWGWVAARGWDRHREERRAGQAGEAGAHG